MKYLLFLLILVLSWSCTDPASVDADREKIVIDDPSKYPAKYEINPNILDFGELLINSEKNIQFNIKNLTNDILTLNNFSLKNNSSNAVFIRSQPLILQANGSELDNQDVSLNLTARNYGYLKDTLLIDNFKNPLIEVRAEIPALFTNDINFADTKISEFRLAIFNFKNISNTRAVISEFELLDSNNVFLIEPKIELPIIVEPNSESVDIKLTFNPVSPKVYIAEIRIKATFDGVDYPYKKVVKLSGFGIQ